MEFLINYGHTGVKQMITHISTNFIFGKRFERDKHGNVNVYDIADLPSQKGLKDRQELTRDIKQWGENRKGFLQCLPGVARTKIKILKVDQSDSFDYKQ